MTTKFPWREFNEKYPVISTRVSKSIWNRLEARCKQIGEPRSLVVKGMIEACLDITDIADVQKGKSNAK
jgi:predicted DNA-binding protein